MPATSNIKSDNQYYGKYFEIATVTKINNEKENPNPKNYDDIKDYDFTENEIEQLNKDAQILANYIGKDHTAKRVGNHTVSGIGDIIIDDNIKTEIKRVSAGTGTYHNTSVYYFTSFGFDFKKYMEKFKLRETIEKYFPDIPVSYSNNSPVNQTNSSKIRHSTQFGYEEIKQIDEKMRMEFVQDLVNFFRNNPEKAQIFYKDMVNKQKISQQKESIVDRFIVFNYNKQSIMEISLDTIKNNPINTIYVNDFGFCIGSLRIQIGWQNGNGLNNPTIRVFLK